MAPRKPNPAKSPRLRLTIDSLLTLPIWGLIAVGDAVRAAWRLTIATPAALFFILLTLIRELGKAASSWMKEKIPQKKLRTPAAPVQKAPRPPVVPWTFRLPRIALPHVSLPRIELPALPRVSLKLPFLQRRAIPLPTQPALPTIVPESPSHRTKSFFAGVVVTILFFFIPYNAYQFLMSLPNPHLLARRDLEVTTKIYDRNGALLYEIYADQNRTPVPLDEIPKFVVDATIAIEDQDFYRHKGVSLRGIARSLREIILYNRVQGGSTITQQLIKSALLTPEVKLSRKIREVALAFWAERIYSKNEILEMYLNQVPYGGTAWGIEAASQTYFGKSVKALSLAEAALLAGLPAAPTQYSPFGSHPEKAFERQAEVLRRMVEDRAITKEEAAAALAQKVSLVAPRVAIRAPHFVMYVKNMLEERYGTRLVERGGLRITTSLDITMQEKAEEILRGHVESLRALRVGNGAALVTNPSSGEILAMVGSKNYFDLTADGNVNVTTSHRQPGSAIKVVTYASALEHGFTAATIIDDSAVIYRTPGSPPYQPVNYDGKFHGPTPLRYALGNSYNIPAVKTLATLGLPTMIATGRAMGIASWEDEGRYGLSLTLGGGEVTMLEMAQVYGTLANAGRHLDLLPVLEVTDYTGRVIEKSRPKGGYQAIKPETAWILTNILSDNNARTAAFGPSSSLVVPGHTVAVKTGTSNDKRDNWTVGYTPGLLAAVWVGNNNNAPMDPYLTSGVTGAAPIWHDLMVEFLKGREDVTPPKPEGVVSVPCYFGRIEYFIKGTQPTSGRCGPLPTPSASPSPTP